VKSVSALDIAVKESGELRFRERAHARRLEVAVLEEHERRDAADAEFRRYHLVLVDVDLRHLEAAVVLPGDVVQDRCDRLAWAAPLGPVIHQYGSFGLQDFRLERVVGDVVDGSSSGAAGTCHGSSGVITGRTLLWGR